MTDYPQEEQIKMLGENVINFKFGMIHHYLI